MKYVTSSGWRKTAVARAVIKEGKGRVRINKIPLEVWRPLMAKMRIEEAIILAGDFAKNLDIVVKVHGGGWSAQADAVRTAIARGIVEFVRRYISEEKAEELKKIYKDYDRTLLVPDTRMTEPQKPYWSAARRMRQTSKR